MNGRRQDLPTSASTAPRCHGSQPRCAGAFAAAGEIFCCLGDFAERLNRAGRAAMQQTFSHDSPTTLLLQPVRQLLA
jgi:hypothetical protein